jgi:hypothetical protein
MKSKLLFVIILWVSCLVSTNLVARSAVGQSAHQVDWYVLLLNGEKVGFQKSERIDDGKTITLREEMNMAIVRGETTTSQSIQMTTVENQSGPVSFEVIEKISGLESRVSGTRAGKKFEVTELRGGATQKRLIEMPTDVLFGEAVDRLLQNAKLKVNQKLVVKTFDPSVQQIFPIETVLLGYKYSDLPAGTNRLLEIRQTSRIGGGTLVTTSLVDEQFRAHRVSTDIGGVTLVQALATEKLAKAPNSNSRDFFDRLMIQSPRAIAPEERQNGLQYELTYLGEESFEFPNSDEQRVRQKGNRIVLDVCQRCGKSPADQLDAKLIAESKKANAWLQSDDIELKALAQQAARGASTDLQKMRQLERFVNQHIANKGLDVGYATAKETLASKSGDCTEHALLLAAMGRSVGIATRVATGFAYAEQYVQRNQIFVPHAWTQAFVNGQWQSFDAALMGFDAGHILVGFGDGDPYRYFAAQTLLGNLSIDGISVATKVRP